MSPFNLDYGPQPLWVEALLTCYGKHLDSPQLTVLISCSFTQSQERPWTSSVFSKADGNWDEDTSSPSFQAGYSPLSLCWHGPPAHVSYRSL